MNKYLLTLVALLCLNFSFGQVSESFESWTDASYGGISNVTLASGIWENNNSLLGSIARTGSKGVRFNDDSGQNEYLEYQGIDGNGKDNGIGNVSFWYRHWNGDGSNVEFQVQYNQSGGGWINIGSVINVTSTTYQEFTASPNVSGDDIIIRVISINDAERLMIDDFEITDYTTAGPTLTVSPSSLTGLDYVFGSGPSAEQTFDITGSLLTGDITITAPTNFEISLTSGSGFSGSLIISSASANSTNTIYIRLASGLAINTYTGNIDVSSTGATSRTVSLTGDVTAAPPSNDLCSGAISLTPTTSCSYTTYTNLNATDSGVADPGCASYNGGDVWFSVVVPASGEITVDTNNIGFTDSGMAMYTGSCGSLTFLECDDDDSPNGAMSSITQTGLSVGSTV